MKVKLILPVIAALLMGSVPAFAEGGTHEQKDHAGMEKGHMNCPHQAKDVKTEKKAIENGIEITMTTENPEAVAGLREKAAADYTAKDCPMLKDSKEVTVENIEKGVKVTITAKTPKAVKKLQASVKKGGSCCDNDGNGEKTAVKSAKKAAYVCPMGDFEGSDKPGKCPKCGMNLVANK